MLSFWKKKRLALRTRPIQELWSWMIVGALIAGIAHGLTEILDLARAQWFKPVLFGDSFGFVLRDKSQPLIAWLFAQHNEHRIVWAKAISLVESELLSIPAGQSAILQNLVLILSCAGLWSWLCCRILLRRDIQLITALCGWLLLLNPWQYENIAWEFQTPWFFINALVLLGSLLLSFPAASTPSRGLTQQNLLSSLLPWIAIGSSGQGVALSMAFAACAWLHSRRLGTLVTGSTALAILSFFVMLPYSKPAHHPDLSFNLHYFLRVLLGGPWQGLAVLCVCIAAVMLGRRQSIPKANWPALLMPGLFSLIFAGMITLSRSGFGVEQANSSRYITHSLMLGLSALMALSLLDTRNDSRPTPVLGGLLVLITTLGSFPQGLQTGGLSYADAWGEGQRWSKQNRQAFKCHSQRAAMTTPDITLLKCSVSAGCSVANEV